MLSLPHPGGRPSGSNPRKRAPAWLKCSAPGWRAGTGCAPRWKWRAFASPATPTSSPPCGPELRRMPRLPRIDEEMGDAMPERPRDAEREHRIEDEIVVDCYSPEEQATGWYAYLD